jgi:hypothetical protein
MMRYWLNVYRNGFVYTVSRFYTAWTQSRRQLNLMKRERGRPMFIQHVVKVLSAFGNCPVRLSFSEGKFVFDYIENIVEVRTSCLAGDPFCLPDR